MEHRPPTRRDRRWLAVAFVALGVGALGCATDVVLATLDVARDAGPLRDAGSDASVAQGDGGDVGAADGGGADAAVVDVDAGADAGADVDAGFTDAGLDDAGAAGDGGSLDAGSDGGATDAGASDAGTADAGTSDAGTSDAGVIDAGPIDGGIPDLALVMDLPVVVELGELVALTLTAANAGGSAALDVTSDTALPDGGVFQGGAGCSAAAGRVACSFGTVPGRAAVSRSFTVSLGPGTGSRLFATSLATTSPDLQPQDNFVQRLVGQTAIGTDVLPPMLGRILDGGACFGTVITSWSQCVVGSRLYFQLVLEDGGFRELSDTQVGGRWGHSPSLRNFGFQFFYPDGGAGTQYWGSTVSPDCIEGGLDLITQLNRGAWRACVHTP